MSYQDKVLAVMIFFFLLFFLENLYLKSKRKADYSLPDTMTNLICCYGGMSLMLILFLPLAYVYNLTFFNLRFFTVPFAWWTSILVFILIDFTKYVYHYYSHHNNLLWSVHVVHHQSQLLNFSTTFRYPWYLRFIEWPIHLPAALLGINIEHYFAIVVIHAFIQVWTHTESYDFPYLEKILIVPSHHRVHHAVQDEYSGKNFGAVLSIWDHMFGTFCKETEKPIYGVSGMPSNYDLIRLNNRPIQVFVKTLKAQPDFKSKLRFIFLKDSISINYAKDFSPFVPSQSSAKILICGSISSFLFYKFFSGWHFNSLEISLLIASGAFLFFIFMGKLLQNRI